MKNKKESSNHWGEMTKSLAGGFFKKISLDLVLGVKEQWDKFLFRTRSGMIALMFTLLGLIFIVIGLALLIGSVFREIPGAGFMLVGVILALIGWIANLVRKMI